MLDNIENRIGKVEDQIERINQYLDYLADEMNRFFNRPIDDQLDRMNIKSIENYLRKKKLNKLNEED